MKYNKYKKGITLTALVIYVILLITTITTVTIISSNVNERMFNDKGIINNIKQINKLQFNITKSTEESNLVSVFDENKIGFSNGDEYFYNAESNTIFKNNRILITEVESLIIEEDNNSYGIKIRLEIKLKKYLNELDREIIVFVEEEND